MYQDTDRNSIPSGQFINSSDIDPNPIAAADLESFDTLKHEYQSAMEYIKELEAKNKALVAKNIELENKIGTGNK